MVVIATPAIYGDELFDLAVILEHESDDAIGEAVGQVIVKAKEAGFNIFSPSFLVVVTFEE